MQIAGNLYFKLNDHFGGRLLIHIFLVYFYRKSVDIIIKINLWLISVRNLRKL